MILPLALIDPVVTTFPPETLPVTDKLDSVPTDVMFGCAAVVTVPAVVALVAVVAEPADVA